MMMMFAGSAASRSMDVVQIAKSQATVVLPVRFPLSFPSQDSLHSLTRTNKQSGENAPMCFTCIA